MSEPGRPALLAAHGLTVRAGDQELVRDAAFSIEQGELVLVVGPSGSGKTALLKLIAGITRPRRGAIEVEGRLEFEGQNLIGNPPQDGRIGILFQDHALFDDLDPRENIVFALRHRRRHGRVPLRGDRATADGLLEELDLRPKDRLRTMSGGQLQRLALARALALDPDLILYDEPTTGLDPARAQQAVDLIVATHRRAERTTLIVTHDSERFLAVADRVLLLDTATHRVLEVAPAEVTRRLETRTVTAPPRRPRRPLLGEHPVRSFLEATTDVLVATTGALLHLVPRFPRWRYGLRALRHALALAASPGAFLYVGIAGVLMGFVATYYTFKYLPKREFTEPLFMEDVLRALGYMLYRVLAPILLTLLVAARTGAAVASDLGNKVYARQFDALRSFGVRPASYLLTSNLWALLLSMPLLLATLYLTASVVSLAVFVFTHPDQTFFFWSQNFYRMLRAGEGMFYRGTWWLLAKVEVCAFAIAAIAWFCAARDKETASDVARAVTRTIIAASLSVLFVHFFFAFFEF